ncbi:MAG TPA: hypothetical protein VNN10_10460 [Dehalococcoidia bacterium]|nr:hypothetical protein [Dehalococcoidia bacterium]
MVEDFSTVFLGTMAAWRPVLEYSDDGALDTVVPPGSGEALLRRLESAIDAFGAKALRTRGERFDCPRFKVRIDTYLRDRVDGARRH